MKKIYDGWRFSGLIATLLLLPIAAHAQYTYTTNSGKITITSYTGSGGNVIIPGTINGLPVTSIGANVFYSSTSLTSIIIPSSVTNIGSSAFFNCAKLTSIYFQGNAPNVGSVAFKYDSNATVYYLNGTKGWTNSWNNQPTALYQLQYWQYPANGWLNTYGGNTPDPFGLGGYSMGSWRVKAAADVNGDGLADLFWQTPDGWVTAWYSQPDGTYQGQSLGNMGAWTLCAATAKELFWQHPSGWVVLWYMNTNGTVINSVSLGNLGGWKLKGAANVDGNGNGEADLFFQSAAGDVVVWMSNGLGGYTGHLVGNLGLWDLRAAYAVPSANVGQLYFENPDGWVVIWNLNANCTFKSSQNWGNIANAKVMAVQ